MFHWTEQKSNGMQLEKQMTRHLMNLFHQQQNFPPYLKNTLKELKTKL